MSGESTSRVTAGVEPLERAFGDAAACNRCGVVSPDYRVIATFLHDTVAVRAYCGSCYPEVEGEYHARGDGLLMGFGEFARRFGSPGPPPPPCTPVDGMLAMLLRDPTVRSLAPASEALARRTRTTPYRFRVVLEVEGAARAAELAVNPTGRIEGIAGDPEARERLRAMLASPPRG
jgi:hypothetical protein